MRNAHRGVCVKFTFSREGVSSDAQSATCVGQPDSIFLPVRAATTDEAFRRIVGMEAQERLDKSALLRNLRENKSVSSQET